jgi:hypothetical protein
MVFWVCMPLANPTATKTGCYPSPVCKYLMGQTTAHKSVLLADVAERGNCSKLDMQMVSSAKAKQQTTNFIDMA